MKPILRKSHAIIAATFLFISSYFSQGLAQNKSLTKNKDVTAFEIAIPDKDVQQLKDRLRSTRWTDAVNEASWKYGASLPYMKSLVNYWYKDFDWKNQQKRLNQFDHYKADIDGVQVHFIHQAGQGSSSTPIVLLHGWPSSFVQMLDIIPLLTKPDARGHSFDVIVPSLPGYGFSDRPTDRGFNVYKMAELLHTLMTEKLGYESFLLRASDIGAGVAKEWAIAHPKQVIGLHLSGSNPYAFQVPDNLTSDEKDFLAKGEQFMMAEGAYAMEQSTKPQTLAFGLNDSPVGLAAWIIEKFNSWSDHPGNLEALFTKDELLTNICIYWFTQTIGSSMRVYYESAHTPSPNAGKKVEVPTAFMMLSNDIAVGPRSWEERTYNVVRWNQHTSGGHFGEWEKPEVIARDIITFNNSLN